MIVPTPAQQRAIGAPLGPTLVLAGPGAGKTFCLIERIRFLVAERGFPPERVCAVTFTNKAADEIASRLRAALGQAADLVTRGTLHALCADLLRAHGETLGIPRGFGVADDGYQRLLLRRLGVHGRRRVHETLDAFGRARLRGATLPPREADLLARYHAQLRRRGLLDFDDLVAEALRLLVPPDGAVARAIAARWDAVLVDEFQDLDPAQYQLLRTIAAGHGNLFGVGDDEQSIFSWRGADPTVLRRFVNDFQITAPVVLDRNRRCARPIFERARQLIQMDEGLFAKDLVADRESPYPVTAVALPDEHAEAAFLVDDLRADHVDSGLPWGEVAVLYRTHEVGSTLEGALLQAGIPCRLARGRALQDDPVAGHVIAALRLMRQPDDPVLAEAFAERVLPQALLERVRMHARTARVPLLDAVRAVAGSLVRGSADARRLWRLLYHIEGLAAQYRAHATLRGLVETLLSQRIGPYTNVLEEREDELTDPAAVPGVVSLADQLAGAMHGRGRVVLEARGPARVGLRGLLLAAGLTRVTYGDEGAAADDVPLDADVVSVFKALQLVHCRDLAHQFEDFVAFDLETTDRDVQTCEIVEIGAVRVRGGRVVDRFRRLVRPVAPVTAGATAVHGYTADHLADAPPFAEVWPAFRAFVGADLLVAHNAFEFDLPVLRRLAEPLGGADDLVVYDSLILARALVTGRATLEALAERFAVSLPRAHHALDDAEALAGVFTALSRLQLARTRKSALAHLLDYLGLGLALGGGPTGDEAEMLREVSRTHALGPYSDCLEFYEAERRRLDAADLPPLDVVVDRLGGQALLERLRTERTAEQRYPAAYARLMRLAGERDGTLGEDLERLLERVALSTSLDAEVDPARVNLLTLHATKGLEFSRVYVVGVEDHQLPGWGALAYGRTEEIREARRLLYVGMTRARDRLVLTRVDVRRGREAGGHRFLDEMGVTPERLAGPR